MAPDLIPRAGRRLPARNPSVDLPPVAEVPKQRRSQQVLDRIVAASRELLATRDFASIGIADVARHAGVSVGVFYTRFATKEHLLAHLARDLAMTMRHRAETELAPAKVASLTLREIAERYFALAAATFAEHRAILRPLTLVIRLEAHHELRDLVAAFNADVHGIFRERLLVHRARIRHADPEQAVDFAILAGSAALREIILYGEPVSRLSRRTRAAARDAARLCAAYLET